MQGSTTNNDIAPMPFDQEVLKSAYRLKRVGLPWSPHVGCFVWDRQGNISVPSPFPNNVYFILNLNRFLQIFGSLEKMSENLVWLPTTHQALELCRNHGVFGPEPTTWPSGRQMLSGKETLLRLYERIAAVLEAPTGAKPVENRPPKFSSDEQWVRAVMANELGSLSQFPDSIQQQIRAVYAKAGQAYLGWRRVQERQDSNWYPGEIGFDADLLQDLKHFYSDYQQIILALEYTRSWVRRIRFIDPETDPERFAKLLTTFIRHQDRCVTADQVLEQLMDRGDYAVS